VADIRMIDGAPVLFGLAPEVEPVTIGGAPVEDKDGQLDLLPDASRKFIERELGNYDGASVRLQKSKSDSNVVIYGQEGVHSSFLVPTKDSDPAFITEVTRALEPPRTNIPEGVTADEWDRRVDLIREAAGLEHDLEEQDARDFLKGRVASVDAVDIAAFRRDVREQRLDHLVDALDAHLRAKVEGARRARRYLRLVAPKGWLQRTFNSLTDAELLRVLGRLERRDYKRGDLKDHILGRIKDDHRREQLSLQFAQQPPNEGHGLRLADFAPEDDIDDDTAQREQFGISTGDLMKFAEALREQPAPVINVHVDGRKGGKVRKTPVRGDDGLIQYVDEEELDG